MPAGNVNSSIIPAPQATLYTFAATTAATFRPYIGSFGGQFDMQVGEQVDPAKYQVEAIDYPGAHMAWDGVGNEAFLPGYTILAGCQEGANHCIDLIAATPGKFAFSAYSLGSVVASLVYKALLPGGQLADRAGDFLGAVTFGSSVREAGHTIPGGTDPGGHGCFGAQYRMTGTPTSWWDFADSNPLDPFTTTGDDTAGQDSTAVADIVLTGTEFTYFSEVVALLQSLQPDLAAQIPAIWTELTEMFFPFLSPNDNTTGHGNYGSQPYQGLPGTTETAVQLAVDYLNSLMQPNYRQVSNGVLNYQDFANSFAQIGAGGPPDPAKDPLAMYRYLDARRQAVVAEYHQRPMARLLDGNNNVIGTLAQEISASVEEQMLDSGTANMVIRKDNWLSDFIQYDRRAEQDLNIAFDPIPTMLDWPYRWGGKITTINGKRDSRGVHTVELTAVSNREHLKHITARANPLFPPELQIPKMWILPWNCRTALTLSLIANLARAYEPGLSLFANLLNPVAWLGQNVDFNLGYINPLSWPVQPQWLNPVFDTSRFEVFTSRWQDLHASSQTILEDAGCIWRAYLYMKGDLTSPNPELAGLGNFFGTTPALGEVTDQMTRPTRNAVILAVEDKSGTTGWTGTALDGPIKMISATATDLVTSVLLPQYDAEGDTYYLSSDGQKLVDADTPTIDRWFETAPQPPWAVYMDTEHSGMIEAERIQHTTMAKTVAVGGKSPGWINDLITFGIKFGLSQLQTVIVAGLFGSAGGPPIGAGLDELYQGELDDTVAAFQVWTDPARAFWTGDAGFLEQMEPGTGAAWTVSGVLGLRAAQWKTRPYSVYKTTVAMGYPYCLFRDYFLGDRVGFQMGNLIFVDQVSSYKYSWDKDNPLRWEVSIGTDWGDVDPVSKAMRSIAGIWNMFGMWMGSSELF
jgi:hypothetical protein